MNTQLTSTIGAGAKKVAIMQAAIFAEQHAKEERLALKRQNDADEQLRREMDSLASRYRRLKAAAKTVSQLCILGASTEFQRLHELRGDTILFSDSDKDGTYEQGNTLQMRGDSLLIESMGVDGGTEDLGRINISLTFPYAINPDMKAVRKSLWPISTSYGCGCVNTARAVIVDAIAQQAFSDCVEDVAYPFVPIPSLLESLEYGERYQPDVLFEVLVEHTKPEDLDWLLSRTF